MGTLNDALKRLFFTSNSRAATTSVRIPILDNHGTPVGKDTLLNTKVAMGVEFRKTATASSSPATWRIWDNNSTNEVAILKIVLLRYSTGAVYGVVDMVVGGDNTVEKTKVLSASNITNLELYRKREGSKITYYAHSTVSTSSNVVQLHVTQLTGTGGTLSVTKVSNVTFESGDEISLNV